MKNDDYTNQRIEYAEKIDLNFGKISLYKERMQKLKTFFWPLCSKKRNLISRLNEEQSHLKKEIENYSDRISEININELEGISKNY